MRAPRRDEAFNYRTQEFEKEILRATGGKGVNVILDMVGGDYVPRELKCLADDGRLVFIAYLRGPKAEIDIDAVMRRRLTISGSTLRPRPSNSRRHRAQPAREDLAADRGRPIKPEIYQTFPLEQAAEAHRLMESSQHIGKLVLRLDASLSS